MVLGRAQATSFADKARLPVKVGSNPPAVILVEPQLGENIGTTSRAMMNCGLTDLRLVDPKEDWLSEKALAASSGANEILEKARRFATTEEAIADLEVVYATTARRREMVKTVMTARAAAGDMRARTAAGERLGLLFGRERIGLTNHELSLANTVIEVPLNPEHSSLNLAQAVLVVGYEWFQAGYEGPEAVTTYNKTKPVSKELLQELFDHLEQELILCGFLRNDEKRPSMVVNIRNMLQRAELTIQEVRTLHGIIKELRYGRREDRPKRQPGFKADKVGDGD
jgi:tRNA/rRNA methyltransferase